ncbi:MAG TPA: hypothetical protein VH143_33580 [Kofleriaceae bacterium]|nr:hypothetical protein [Kofleriaceae bacterium]
MIEVAAFCKTQGPNDGAKGAGDPQRPGEVLTQETYDLQVCPADDTMPAPALTNADPSTWYVRVQFDELLDPKIEDLVPVTDANGNPTGAQMGTLANTQPVTLQCQSSTGNGALVDVPYDGYYDPSGDSVSYPLGPSLVIQPADPTLVATGSMCQVTLKSNIKDKDENPVPSDQLGPYTWTIGTIAVTAISPTDGSMVDPAAAGVDLTFNAAVDFASIVTSSTLTPTVPNLGGGALSGQEAPNEVFVGGDFPDSSPTYTFGITSVNDSCGKTTMLGAPSDDNNTMTTFSTNPLALNSITGADTPANNIVLAFNQFMDPASASLSGATPTGFTLTPPITNMVVTDSGPNIIILGSYKLGTSYTFTLNGTAGIDDCPGGEDQLGNACAKTTTFTNGTDQTVTFTTDAAIMLNSTTPMDNATISPADVVGLSFNQTIDPTTVMADITAGTITVSPSVALAASADPFGDVSIAPTATAGWAPGTYTFTIKGSASFGDGIAGDGAFTNGTDIVIHFTVPPPATGGATGCL